MESPSVLSIMTAKDIVEMDDDQLERLYGWVDDISLSRPKKNMARDFSDGVLAAEVCKFYAPKLVELHNYAGAHAVSKKVTNWQLLNRKVLSKLGLELSGDVIRSLTQCRTWAIESFLSLLRDKIDLYLAAKRGHEIRENGGMGGFGERGGMGGYGGYQPHHQQHQQQPQHYLSEPDMLNNFSSRSAFSDKTEVDQHNHRNSGSYMPLEDFYPTGMVNVPRGTDHRKLNKINQPPPKVSPRKGGKLPKVEMVPRTQLDEKEKEVEDRQQTIEILQGKVQRLEHLLHLKDIRIEDLSSRVELLEGKVQSNEPNKPKRSPPYKPGGQGVKAGGGYGRR